MQTEISEWIINGPIFSFTNALAFVLLLVTLILTVVNTRVVSEKKIKVAVILLKTLVVIMLFAFLLNPIKVVKKITYKPTKGVMLLDNSFSMTLNNAKGEKRNKSFFRLWNNIKNNKKLRFELFDLDFNKHKDEGRVKFTKKNQILLNS